MIKSFLDPSVLSEESQKLKILLQAMNSGENTQELIKSAEEFFLDPDNKLRIKLDDISNYTLIIGRFLLGDTETKGFIQLAFASPTGHIRCCSAIEALNRLLSRNVNIHYERFHKVFSNVSANRLREFGFVTHIESAGMRKCRTLCFEFLKVYEIIHNVPESQTGFKLIDSESICKSYRAWREREQILSQDPAMTRANNGNILPQLDTNYSTVNIESPHNLDNTMRENTNKSDILSFKGVLSQEPACEDLEYKHQVFKKAASDALCQISVRPCERMCFYLDVVNRDMLLVRLRLPIESKGGFGRFSAFDIFKLKRILNNLDPNKRRASASGDDINFLKNVLSIKSLFMKKKPQSNSQIRFVSTNKLELKVHIKDQTYKLILGLTEQVKIPTMVSNEGIKLKFGTSNLSTFPNKSYYDCLLTVPINQVNMLVSSTTSLHQGSDKILLEAGIRSSTSTAALSTSNSTFENPEIECNIHGDLTIKVNSVINSTGVTSAQLCFDVFVAAESSASKVLLESLISSHSALECMMTDIFELMASS